MSNVDTEYRYKEQVPGYDLGAFVIEVGRAIGRVHPMLPEYEYENKLSEARSLMQSLMTSIPYDVYRKFRYLDIKTDSPEEFFKSLLQFLDRVEKMSKKELLLLHAKITTMLDMNKLLVAKKYERRTSAGGVNE